MKAVLGYAGVGLGFSAAVTGILVLLVGLRRGGDARLFATGRKLVWLVLGGALLAAGMMEWALLSHDFSVEYVAENHSRATPVLYTVASMWGALEGSILLWGLVLGGYLVVMVHRFRDRGSDPLVVWATVVGLGVAVFFFALMLGPANPFRTLPGSAIPADGAGPNPLLQNHPLMAIHPPVLYLGYVGFTVPFAFATAALITGRLGEGWLLATRRATLVSWGFLSAGIMLGAWWSYEVLGWGGYWAWDPVENASFIPWLTATAYLHSVVVQERRGMLRVWNLSLVLATFCLTILGTFLTRSGVIESVHSFTVSPVGPWLLTFLGACVFLSVGLIAWRGDRLRSPGRIDSPVSREGAFLGNNLLFAGFAFVVLLGTVYPLLVEALNDRRLTVGEPYFERMTLPLGLALLFLMAVAPALPWRAASGEVLRRRLGVPAWAGALTMVAVVAGGGRGLAQIAAFGLAGFALAGVARSFVVGTAARRRAPDNRGGWPGALAATVAGNRRLYGGLVVHTGIVVVAVAMAASSGYVTKREFRLGENETATLSGHTFTYLGTERDDTAQKRTLKARVLVERGGDTLGVYTPALSQFPNMASAIGTPSVHTSPLRDVYLTLVRSAGEDGKITLGVQVNPLVVWLWIGGGVIVAGCVVAIWPNGRRHRRGVAPAPDYEAGGPVEATAERVLEQAPS